MSKGKSIELGPLESRLLFTLEEQGTKFFSFREAKQILKASDQSVRDVLFRLRRKGRIAGIERGKYALNPARSGLAGHWSEDAGLVVGHLLEDYYVGFWSALQHWGLTEQLPQTLQVATLKERKDLWYAGQRIEFIAISKQRFFGFVDSGSERFRVASREKAVLDALLYPQHCGGLSEAAKALWQARSELDWGRLLAYLRKLGVSSVQRRLGYLLEIMELKEDVQEQLRQDFAGLRWLDPSRAKKARGYSRQWGLQLNLTREELLEWRAS